MSVKFFTEEDFKYCVRPGGEMNLTHYANNLLNQHREKLYEALGMRKVYGKLFCDAVDGSFLHGYIDAESKDDTTEYFYMTSPQPIEPVEVVECDHIVTLHGGTKDLKFEMMNMCPYCPKCGTKLDREGGE